MSVDSSHNSDDDAEDNVPRDTLARNRISVVLPVEDGDLQNGGQPASTMFDNYDLEESTSDDDYTLSDKMAHYIGGHITQDHWHACKAVLVFHAGCMVCKLSPMSKAAMQNTCLEGYRSAVADLDCYHFGNDARAFFLSSFRKKDEPMSADSLYRYFQDSRNKMRSLLVPLLPPEFMTMKSGRGFHETCKDVVIKEFRKECVSREGITREEADQKLPAMFWQYKGQPWVFFLCVQIFRRHPQLAPNVSEVLQDIANVPESRAAMKRKAQIDRYNKSKKAVKMVQQQQQEATTLQQHAVAMTDVEATNQRHATWAKVHMAKAMEENANVARKLGEIEAVAKSLSILAKIRDVLGEEVYASRVKDIVASIPHPKSFAKECVVVCIDDEEKYDKDDDASKEDDVDSI